MTNLSKKILVVDDDPAILTMVAEKLKENGYAVVTAKDGEETLKVVSAEKPDLIILDLVLPKLDGWRVCQKLKRDELYKRIPIVLLSGLIDDESGIQSMEEGDAFLGKPINEKKMLTIVKGLLENIK